MSEANKEIKYCPFCGHSGLNFREGSTFRWLLAECADCGATCGEVRVQTTGAGTHEEWNSNARAEAIRAWNTRAEVAKKYLDCRNAPDCACYDKQGTRLIRKDCPFPMPASTQQETANQEVVGNQSLATYPDKCPITRRNFFMVIEHPDLGAVPTYGGPYDSYTIPHMDGSPGLPFHVRELICHRYDHDEGCWVDDEMIPMRVINEDTLNELLEAQDVHK